MILLYFLVFVLFSESRGQDIVACGGLIKADVNKIDFTQITAQLYLADDTLNYETDILPNGAFSIPVYDSGSYKLKVTGPKGWFFEPENGYPIIINDHNSCSDDYTFKFKGFSIFGKIATANIDRGPSGIEVDVLQSDKLITKSKSLPGGDFQVKKVMPGNYLLRINLDPDNKSTNLKNTEYMAVVNDDNLVIKEPFIIQGFPVIGDIKFDREPLKDVAFYLFSKAKLSKETIQKYKCNLFDISEMTHVSYFPFCKVISNSNGEYIFSLLPGGSYSLIGSYSIGDSIYEIKPTEHKFDVTSNAVNLKGIFKITGFSLNGFVKNIDNETFVGAKVYVNGQFKTQTDSDGKFTIFGAQKGLHNIQIFSDGYIFDKSAVRFDPKHNNIGTFRPSKISICGSVILDVSQSLDRPVDDIFKSLKLSLYKHQTEQLIENVSLLKAADDKIKIEKKDNLVTGSFCFYAKPESTYLVKPNLDPSVGAFSLAPSNINVELKSQPVFIKFSQFRGKISGSISCIEKCKTGDFEVILKSDDPQTNNIQLTQHISVDEKSNSKHGSFIFKNVDPGRYTIELVSTDRRVPITNKWCWSKSIYKLTLVDHDLKLPVIFSQTGHSLPILSTHSIKTKHFYLNQLDSNTTKRELLGELKLNKGRTTVCLQKSGSYEFEANVCHKLKRNTFQVNTEDICSAGSSSTASENNNNSNTNNCEPVRFEVDKFKIAVGIKIINNDNSEDNNDIDQSFEGFVSFMENGLEEKIEEMTWNSNNNQFEYWANPNIPMKILVNSSRYLLNPSHFNFTVNRNTQLCETNVGTFVSELGKFINGAIEPAMENIEVTLNEVDNSSDSLQPISTTLTDLNGQFEFGPLNGSFVYKISLMMSNYSFEKKYPKNDNDYVYLAKKLSELKITVTDFSTNQPIQGILLSIIGDNYRKNELTTESGSYSFLGLLSGKYYIKAMMKELEFTPSGAIVVTVQEGVFKEVEIKAKRTSFSLFGKVASLSGDAEPNLLVEAERNDQLESVTKCNSTNYRNEIGQTDESGLFRIRGLVPECTYNLVLKEKNSKNEYSIIKSYPSQILIDMKPNDIEHVKMIAIRDMHIQEISAMVWAEDKYIDSLQLSVFPLDNPDNIVIVHKFTLESIYFRLSLPKTTKPIVYVVRIQSNLNSAIYTNISSQEKTFTLAPTAYKPFYRHFDFYFKPKERSINDVEISLTLSSVLVPFLILLLTLGFFRKQDLEPLLFQCLRFFRDIILGLFFQQYNSNRQNVSSSTSNTSSSSNSGGNGSSNLDSAAKSMKLLDSKELTEINRSVAKPKPMVIQPATKKVPFWQRSRRT